MADVILTQQITEVKMKLFLPAMFCLTAFLFSSCGSSIVNKDEYHEQIIEVEKAFSKMSEEKGMPAAFLYYAADSVIKLRNNQIPVMSKKELEEDFKNFPAEDAPVLTWEPLKADVSESGDLGYTFGTWILKSKNGEQPEVQGVYFTIWKRQEDGNWKFVMDGGNAVPEKVM